MSEHPSPIGRGELVISGLTKAFGRTEVLRGVDLVVPAGSLTAVLGASGCGKTTLLRLIAGLERPDRGTLWLGDREVCGPTTFVPPERRRVGLVPQEGALFGHRNVARNIAFGLPGRDPARRRKVEELLELVGLAGFEDRMPADLSGGQQQRVALARALAPEPEVILLDEPFSSLDAGLRAAVRTDVVHALRETGATAVLVTHDQEEALSTADQVAVLRDGRIVQVGPPPELYAHPVDAAVAAFIGDANLFPATIDHGTARTPLGLLDLAAVVDSDAAPGTPGRVMVRPEQVRLTKDADAVAARVVETQFYGHDAVVHLNAGDVRVLCRTSSTPPAIGTVVFLRVDGPVRFYA